VNQIQSRFHADFNPLAFAQLIPIPNQNFGQLQLWCYRSKQSQSGKLWGNTQRQPSHQFTEGANSSWDSQWLAGSWYGYLHLAEVTT